MTHRSRARLFGHAARVLPPLALALGAAGALLAGETALGLTWALAAVVVLVVG